MLENDALFLNKTWQTPNDFLHLNSLASPGFNYLSIPRLKGRGGGLVVIFGNNLNFLVIDSYRRSSFEHLVCKLPGPIPLLAVLIYRPPPMQTSFLSDLSEL